MGIKVFFVALLISYSSQSQQSKQMMAKLNCLVGEWVGTSTTFENGDIVNHCSAFERISYDLDSSILVIELNSEFLKLHTIVRYDEKEQTYFYHPFYEKGAGKYPAKLIDGRLVVQPNEKRRFIFSISPEGEFIEYGEKLVDGKWQKYFEDIFVNTK